ncbi:MULTISPECIES: hypothetical protein [Olivibacter]|uniref:Phage terminase large subunit-like protein n=1 Tax=Olivibacter jilunii TaxID=985016 RepID=A0ABW6AW56_9SPHI
MISTAEKRAIFDWDEFVINMQRQTPVDLSESPEDKRKRIEKLEGNFEEWKKYYFSQYCTSEPADFHIRSSKGVINNPEWYVARPWSRELSKSGLTMMEVLYLTLTEKKKNIVLTSNSKDNAERLLAPYKKNLEKNPRIIADYGVQEQYGSWSADEFITRKGVAFRAIGKGQSPRGTRNEEIRPDVLLIDDFDTDEDCRNPDTVDNDWNWIERAFLGTRSISNPLLVIFCGNIIAENCCMLKAMAMADDYEIVNIRNKHGKSTWPQKNTEEMIDRVLSKISYASGQGEYFNNPIVNGKVFKKLNYKSTAPYKAFKFLVAYCDPSYKSGKKNDFKALALVGKWKDEYHVKKTYCAQTTTANMLDWYYEILKDVNGVTPVYCLIEWPSIDDPIKLEITAANKRHGITLPLKADERVKPEKFYRIESLLEPLNRNEKLWFDISLKTSQHQEAMEAQFKALSPTSRAHDDGPDAVEGAVFAVNTKSASTDTNATKWGKRKPNSKRM